MGSERRVSTDELDLLIERHLLHQIIDPLIDGLRVADGELSVSHDACHQQRGRDHYARGGSERLAHKHQDGSVPLKWITSFRSVGSCVDR